MDANENKSVSHLLKEETPKSKPKRAPLSAADAGADIFMALALFFLNEGSRSNR